MSSLETIVASLELCKKIPAGEFNDSALVWVVKGDHEECAPRTMFNAIPNSWKVYPAPTVVEIMKAIKKMKVCSSICPSNRDNGWFFKAHIRYELPVYGDTAEEAALKMWFKVKFEVQ